MVEEILIYNTICPEFKTGFSIVLQFRVICVNILNYNMTGKYELVGVNVIIS